MNLHLSRAVLKPFRLLQFLSCFDFCTTSDCTLMQGWSWSRTALSVFARSGRCISSL